MDTKAANAPHPSHLYPLPPEFSNPTTSPHPENWSTTLPSTANTTVCLHGNADPDLVSYCKHDFEKLAHFHRIRSLLILETKENKKTNFNRHSNRFDDIKVRHTLKINSLDKL